MSSPIFTPSDEPYLGRHSLYVFDNLICSCLELNSHCAPVSHLGHLTRLQRALCILIPQTITLALSVRELVRQGYLFGAKVLVRPLTERAVTVLYLRANPSALDVWKRGWKHNERPKLQHMMSYLNARLAEGALSSVDGITRDLNSVLHGDPFSARWNVILTDEGAAVHPVSKNLSSPDLVDEICGETIPWLAAVCGIMNDAFLNDRNIASD